MNLIKGMPTMYGDALVFEGVAYYFSDDKKTQDAADAACAEKHHFGRLVEITSRHEMSFLIAIANQKDFGSTNDFYIGELRICMCGKRTCLT